MDGQPYEEAIENASATLAEAMLEDADGLIAEGRQLDRKVKQVVFAVGRLMVKHLLTILGQRLVERAKAQGMTIHRRKTVEFSVLFGLIEIDSVYLYDRSSGQSMRPMRECFGVWGDSCSDGVTRALCDFGNEHAFEVAAERFDEHYGWAPAPEMVRRHTEDSGEHAQEFIEECFDEMRQDYQRPPGRRGVLADEMLVEADGCMIRTGELMTAEQARQRTEDPEQLARLADIDDDKLVRLIEFKEVRTGLARRPGQIEPTYVCDKASWQVIGWQLFGAACGRGLAFDTQVIGVGDGAFGLKEALEVQFAQIQYILDRPHLRHHFFETAERLGMTDGLAARWVDTHLERIDDGQVSKVLAELREQLYKLKPPDPDDPEPEKTPHDRLRRLTEHLERFYHCVDYGQFKDNDWPIGSGEVESAHRYVPQARLKLPGACWREHNLGPMCAMRVLRANGWWDDFWQWLDEQRTRPMAA